MNRRSKTILISSIITILATLIISLVCIDDWSGLTGFAFVMMIFSEIVFFGGLLFAERISTKSQQVITRVAVYVITSVYGILNLLISILYIAFFKQATTSFVVIQVLLFAIAGILIIVTLSASKGILKSDEMTMKAVLNTESMVERLEKLATCPKCKDFSLAFKKLEEDLKFSDTSKTVSEDDEISEVISLIEMEIENEGDIADDKVKNLLERLNTLISQRRISTKAVNKGKI